jgi:hypothetical protein
MFSFLHAVVSFSKREYELETPIHVLLITELKKIQVLEVNSSYTISAGDGDENRSREKRENSLSSLGCTPHRVLGGGQHHLFAVKNQKSSSPTPSQACKFQPLSSIMNTINQSY